MKKKIHIYGGGTFSHVRTHLALATPAFGKTAHLIDDLINQQERFDTMQTELHLTKMAIRNSTLITNDDVKSSVLKLKEDFDTKIIFFNVALCDYTGTIREGDGKFVKTLSGKYEPRLKTSNGDQEMLLTPAEKILPLIRNGRKDIFLVAFKTTSNATEQEQYLAGLNLLKKNSCNLVLANDVVTRTNMIITPEEAKYHITTDRLQALIQLIDMTYYRSHLSFTRSTVVAGEPIQ